MRQRGGRALCQVALFVAGATAAVQIAGVTVTALSVLCLLLVPAFLMRTHRGVDLLPLMLAALGWISFLASCTVNDVSVLGQNAVAPAAFGLYLIGFTVLSDRSVESIVTILAGIAAGTVIFFLTQGIELSRTGNFLDLWKYGIANAVTLLIVYVLTKVRVSRFMMPVALALLGVASLGLNFRSHSLVCITAAAILFTRQVAKGRVGRGWQFAGIVAFVLSFAKVMPIVARAGLLGPALQRKMVEQGATHLPLLLAGRTEPPMTITAITERPLLGWGSAAKLTPDTYAQAEHLAVQIGFSPKSPFELYWRLPVFDYSGFHSILLGSWAEGGLLAVLLPLWLLIACLALVWNMDRFGRWSALALVAALQGIWDLAYAPWTYAMVPQYACIALLFGAVHFHGRQPGRQA